jgi:4-hydroxyphenylpyruvate dioxygenase-like putative hemolysin
MKKAEELNMLTRREIDDIKHLMLKASDDDMNKIADLYNKVLAFQAKKAADKLTVGDKVVWNESDGPRIGIVQKINRKTVIVAEGGRGGGPRWRVTANLLKAA